MSSTENTVNTEHTKDVYELLSMKNSVFTTFVVYTSILIIKMMLMSLITAIQRGRTKVRFIFFMRCACAWKSFSLKLSVTPELISIFVEN